MKKIIKKTGNSLCIILDKEDCKIHNLEEGNIVELELTKLEISQNG